MSNLTSPSQGGGELSLPERTVSVVAGLALAAAAAHPRPNMMLSVLALAAGSFLAFRGATGVCPIRRLMADRTGLIRRRRRHVRPRRRRSISAEVLLPGLQRPSDRARRAVGEEPIDGQHDDGADHRRR